MANRRNVQFLYNPHNKATLLDCSFIVDPANGNGLGIRSLKNSGRIGSVFMHTSATPGVANGQTNPNPASGYIVVTLQDNYVRYLGGFSGAVSALSGSNISVNGVGALTVGNPYVITSLGSTTQAQWVTLGLSSSIKAAVGVSFIAAATTGSGSGVVQAPAASGVDSIEVIGDANLMNNSAAGNILGQGVGMQIILGCYKSGVLQAPTTGSVIALAFYMNDSYSGV
jgi:hypothetical protein